MSTIFETLSAEQREIEILCRKILAARSIELAKATFRVMSGRLLTLLRNERLVVYPQFAMVSGLRDEVNAARAEHAEIEGGIAHLRLASLTADEWFADAARLHMRLRDLVMIEECALFPVARLTLSTEAAQRLCRDFQGLSVTAAHVANVSITYELAS